MPALAAAIAVAAETVVLPTPPLPVCRAILTWPFDPLAQLLQRGVHDRPFGLATQRPISGTSESRRGVGDLGRRLAGR